MSSFFHFSTALSLIHKMNHIRKGLEIHLKKNWAETRQSWPNTAQYRDTLVARGPRRWICKRIPAKWENYEELLTTIHRVLGIYTKPPSPHQNLEVESTSSPGNSDELASSAKG